MARINVVTAYVSFNTLSHSERLGHGPCDAYVVGGLFLLFINMLIASLVDAA